MSVRTRRSTNRNWPLRAVAGAAAGPVGVGQGFGATSGTSAPMTAVGGSADGSTSQIFCADEYVGLEEIGEGIWIIYLGLLSLAASTSTHADRRRVPDAKSFKGTDDGLPSAGHLLVLSHVTSVGRKLTSPCS
jgi:hypothetical protein